MSAANILPGEMEVALRDALGVAGPLRTIQAGGGCINTTCILHHGADAAPLAFLKLNRAECLAMFEAEAAALTELAAVDSGLRVPRPLGCGVSANQAWLLLEFLPLVKSRPDSERDFAAMGAGLARLHRTRSANGCHGWSRDNTIGSTPQPNPWTRDWAAFLRDHRLAPQFDLAARQGRVFQDATRLLERVPVLLADHQPEPSLLHGDLWSGNAAFLLDGTPAVFDPASYYGDRETDLAFSRMFGGFPAAFYTAYESEWPMPPGHQQRARLYNLYHLLNHFNLFGIPYDQQAESVMAGLL